MNDLSANQFDDGVLGWWMLQILCYFAHLNHNFRSG